jgi:hypothetical protein
MAGTSRKALPAVCLKLFGMIPVFCGGFTRMKGKPDMVNVEQVHYYVMCIGEFAREKSITIKDAFTYLRTYKGVEFLIDCYDADHTLSLENAVEDLTRVCRNNGGNIP